MTLIGSLRRKQSKPSVYSRTPPYRHLSNTDTSPLRTISYVPTKFSYILFEPRRVARTYVDVFSWLVSYTVRCEIMT